MQKQTVFVTESDREICDLYLEVLGAEGYTTTIASPRETSARSIEAAQPDVALLEILPHERGLTIRLLEQLRACPATANLPVVLVTTSPEVLGRFAAHLRDLSCRIMHKPFLLDELLTCVENALSHESVRG